MSDDPPRPADLPPGFDEEDPYAGEDLSTYPEWWRRNVEEFEAHDLRPYRPPRFADDEITTERIEALEADLGVPIRFRAVNPRVGDDWELVVDDEAVAAVGRTREGEGFSRYAITAAEFERLVRGAVGP